MHRVRHATTLCASIVTDSRVFIFKHRECRAYCDTRRRFRHILNTFFALARQLRVLNARCRGPEPLVPELPSATQCGMARPKASSIHRHHWSVVRRVGSFRNASESALAAHCQFRVDCVDTGVVASPLRTTPWCRRSGQSRLSPSSGRSMLDLCSDQTIILKTNHINLIHSFPI